MTPGHPSIPGRRSPGPLVINPDGSTDRTPSEKEITAYEYAMQAAMNLSVVEPGLNEMSRYFLQRVGLLREAFAQDKEGCQNWRGNNQSRWGKAISLRHK